jgi:hypothetical protein
VLSRALQVPACAARELLRIRPDFAESCRTELKKWWDSELTEHLIDSLR